MNPLPNILAEAHIADLHREAARARDRATARQAARERAAAAMPTVTLRPATRADATALIRLAALDSSDVPAAPLLVAEVAGELRAAVSLSERTVIADPLHATAPLVRLLLGWAGQARGACPPRWRRILEAVRGRARRARRDLLVQTR